MKKRLLSMILALSMVLTILPFNAITALASGNTTGSFTGSDGAVFAGRLYYSVTKEPEGENNGEVSVVGWAPGYYNQSVTIPESVENEGKIYTITSIGDEAFGGVYNRLKKISIPNTVISIGKKAFRNCEFEEISSLGVVQTIGDSAFEDCKNLTTFPMIGEGTLSIGKGAFSGCTKMTSVTIPSSVNSIGESAFLGCGLTSIDIKNNTISQYEFSGNNSLESITIPSNVVVMGDGAFSGCKKLTQINIRNNVIGKEAFRDCTALESVTVPSAVTSFGESAFSGCTSLNTVTIEENVTSVSKKAFYGDVALSTVNLPSTLKSIGDNAFYNCKGLKQITLPQNLQSIGSQAFAFAENDAGETVGLTSITIPDSVTSIGSSAFWNCKALKDVQLSSQIQEIPTSMFLNCISLTTVNIPDKVTVIGGNAFSGCISLENMTLPDGLMSIGRYAFYGCNGLELTEITLPAGTNTILQSAFQGCTNLKKIYYQHSLSTLKRNKGGIMNLSFSDDDNAALTYGSQNIPVLYQCTVNLWTGEGTMADADKKILVYHTEKVLGTKANDLTALPEPTAPSGYEFTGWYTSNTTKDDTTKFDVDTPITKDLYLYAGYVVERKTITLPDGVTATVDNVPVTIENKQIKAAPNSTVVLTVSDSAYDSNSNYTWSGITGTPSGDNNRTFTFTVGNDNVTITLTSALRKRTFEVPDGATVKTGDTELTPVDGNVEVELTKQITLTVKDPKYGDAYKWLVDGTENTADVTDDGKTLTLTVTDALNKIELVTTKYTYTVDDFVVTKPGDCTYDGQPHPAAVAPKADHGIADDDYSVEYKKVGAADSTSDAPKDAGTYEIIIKKGTEEISAGSFTISPKAPGEDDFTVTLPNGVKEDAEASQKKAAAEVKSDSLLKEDGVTIDYSYRKVNADGSTTEVDAPTDAGEYEFVATIKSTNPNVKAGEVSWPFAIGKKTEQPKPDPKPEEKPDRKMKITGGIVEINGKKAEPDEDGNITVKESDEITITFDKTTLSDAQVFDQWTIKPDSVLNEVDPKSEKISFRMPAETVTVEAMTRDASIQDDGPDLIETAALIGVAGAGAAVLGYQGYMLGTEFALRCMLPAWAVIPQTRAELAVLLWQNADQPESAESTLYTDIGADDTTTQTAAHWAVESGLMALPDAENASNHFDPAAPVTRLEVIRTWNQAQELKK